MVKEKGRQAGSMWHEQKKLEKGDYGKDRKGTELKGKQRGQAGEKEKRL